MLFFSKIPQWAYLIFTIAFIQISHEIGVRVGTVRRLKPSANPESAAAAMSGTTIGLLAFMLAFMFNGAASDYDLRKGLVLEEANAIRTAYLHSTALPDPERGKVRGLLSDYVDIRVNVVKMEGADILQAIAKTSVIQNDLWLTAIALQKNETSASEAQSFADSLINVFDLNAKRIDAALSNRITLHIWLALFFLAFLTMAMMGYRTGLSGIRSNFIEISMALAFSSVLILTIALDNPLGGLSISQQPLVEVLRMISS